MENPNFLILDEPTNDLDIHTLNALEEFLSEFKGCVLIVSHDRYFMDKIVDHLFVFEENGLIRDYPGNYSQYRAWKKAQNEPAKADKRQSAEKPAKQATKTKLSYKEKREFEQLEKEIGELEARKKELTERLSTGEVPYDKMQQLSEELSDIQNQLETKTERWFELADYAN